MLSLQKFHKITFTLRKSNNFLLIFSIFFYSQQFITVAILWNSMWKQKVTIKLCVIIGDFIAFAEKYCRNFYIPVCIKFEIYPQTETFNLHKTSAGIKFCLWIPLLCLTISGTTYWSPCSFLHLILHQFYCLLQLY